MKDNEARERIAARTRLIRELQTKVKGLQEQIDSQQDRLNKHYSLINRVPEIRIRASNIGLLSGSEFVDMPLPNFAHMLLKHLNLELVGGHLELKEIDDEQA